MTSKYLIKNTTIVNERQISLSDILFYHIRIQKIGDINAEPDFKVIDGTGKYLFPGITGGQVHFREPGLT